MGNMGMAENEYYEKTARLRLDMDRRPRQFDPDAPNLVADREGFVVGTATRWNNHGTGEVIVQYFDGSASSEFASELRFPNGRQRAYEWLTAREP